MEEKNAILKQTLSFFSFISKKDIREKDHLIFLKFLLGKHLSISEEWVKKSIQTIVSEIISLLQMDLDNVKINLKYGGYSGTANRKKMRLTMRYDSWLKKDEYQRWNIVIHELLHLVGLNHSNHILYSHTMDYFSSYLLKKIRPNLWFKEFKNRVKNVEKKIIMLRKSLSYDKEYVPKKLFKKGTKKHIVEFSKICEDLFFRLGFTPKKKPFPTLGTKKGGCALTFYKGNHIKIRENTWEMVSLAHKRLFILGELLLFFGKKNGNRRKMKNKNSLEEIVMYLFLWGYDEEFKRLLDILLSEAIRLFGYEKINDLEKKKIVTRIKIKERKIIENKIMDRVKGV